MITKKMIPCFVWIGSAILVGFLLWFFTLPYRTRLLTESVNKTLAQNGGAGFAGSALVTKPVDFSPNPASVMGGTWFTLNNSTGHAFVFTIMQNGIAAACAAFVDGEGKVTSIIPLSDNARQITGELPLPAYRFYVERIEQDARNRGFNRGAAR